MGPPLCFTLQFSDGTLHDWEHNNVCVHACICVAVYVCVRGLSFNVLLHTHTHTLTHVIGVAPCCVPISVSSESARSSSSKAPKISLH